MSRGLGFGTRDSGFCRDFNHEEHEEYEEYEEHEEMICSSLRGLRGIFCVVRVEPRRYGHGGAHRQKLNSAVKRTINGVATVSGCSYTLGAVAVGGAYVLL